MTQSKHRFFIALLPPIEIQDYANEIQQYFAQTYNSRGAQKSPPHITLQPPFEWQLDALPTLEQSLKMFTHNQKPVPITLQGFGAFAPRVIYINVLKTPELLTLQSELMAYLEASLGIIHSASKTRPFVPHLTVAVHDLTKQNFRTAWTEFQPRALEFEFITSELTLLIHDGRRWTVSQSLPFLANN